MSSENALTGSDKMWVLGQLEREDRLPDNPYAEGDENHRIDLFERYRDLSKLALEVEDVEKREFLAQTSHFVLEAGRSIKETEKVSLEEDSEADLWERKINDYIGNYFESQEYVDLDYPPEESDHEFYDETEDLLRSLSNQPIVEDHYGGKIDDYLENYFE